MKQTPNILLLLTDQQATHTLSCYGAPVAKSPHIDQLARDGIRFDRSYTPCALCTPARASLLTGLYPHNHGALFNTGAYMRFNETQTGEGLHTYVEQLKSAGYQTAYSGKWHAGIAATAQDIGFKGFSLPDYGNIRSCPEFRAYLKKIGQETPKKTIEFVAEGGPPEKSGGNFSGWISGTIESAPCHYVANRALSELREQAKSSDPWFMAVNFWEPHAPYLPTEDFKDSFDPSQIKEWVSFNDSLHNRPRLNQILLDTVFPGARDASWKVWATAISRYYAQAAMVDYEVGRLISFLAQNDMYEDTLIIFASDHGESIGVHGGAFDKGGLAYEEVYKIPLIIKLPDQVHAGETRSSLVSLFDLAPTICDRVNQPLTDIDAASLWPVIYDGDVSGRQYLLAEDHGHRVPFGQRILWGSRYKYVWNLSDTDELYDLQDDPAELHNRIQDQSLSAVLSEFREEMYQQVISNGDRLGPQVAQMLKTE